MLATDQTSEPKCSSKSDGIDNGRMRLLIACSTAAALLLGACSPTWNWREFRPQGTVVRLMLPCKPDLAQRQVVLGGHTLKMSLLSCKAGDATFALAWADLPSPAEVPQVMTQWTDATLGNVEGVAGPVSAFPVKGGNLLPQAVRASKSGKQSGGGELSFNGAWFSLGRSIFQASVHGAPQTPEVLDTYFSGIGLP